MSSFNAKIIKRIMYVHDNAYNYIILYLFYVFVYHSTLVAANLFTILCYLVGTNQLCGMFTREPGQLFGEEMEVGRIVVWHWSPMRKRWLQRLIHKFRFDKLIIEKSWAHILTCLKVANRVKIIFVKFRV